MFQLDVSKVTSICEFKKVKKQNKCIDKWPRNYQKLLLKSFHILIYEYILVHKKS